MVASGHRTTPFLRGGGSHLRCTRARPATSFGCARRAPSRSVPRCRRRSRWTGLPLERESGGDGDPEQGDRCDDRGDPKPSSNTNASTQAGRSIPSPRPSRAGGSRVGRRGLRALRRVQWRRLSDSASARRFVGATRRRARHRRRRGCPGGDEPRDGAGHLEVPSSVEPNAPSAMPPETAEALADRERERHDGVPVSGHGTAVDDVASPRSIRPRSERWRWRRRPWPSRALPSPVCVEQTGCRRFEDRCLR